MTVPDALLRWALTHPYLAAGLGLIVIGGSIYLAHKGVNATEEIIKYAAEKGYSFEAGNFKAKPEPQFQKEGERWVFLRNILKSPFEKWIEKASYQELADAYEARRLEWLKTGQNGNGEKTYEMKLLDAEMSRRSAEECMRDPRRNTNPNYRWTDANRWEKD